MKPGHQANVAAGTVKLGGMPVMVPTARSTIAKPAAAKSSDKRDANAPGTARWGAVTGGGEREGGRSWSAAPNEARQEAPQEEQPPRQAMSFSARFHSNRPSLNRYKLQDSEDFPTLATPEAEEAPPKEEPAPAPVVKAAPVPKRKEASTSGFSWADISEDPEAEWMADDLMDRIKGDVAPSPAANMWEERAKTKAPEKKVKAPEKKVKVPEKKAPVVEETKPRPAVDSQRKSAEKERKPVEDRATTAEARRRQADEALAKREKLLRNRGEQQPRGREPRGGMSADEASKKRAAEIKKIADDHKRLLAEEKRRQEEYMKKRAAEKAVQDAKLAEERAKRDAERAVALQEQEAKARAELEAVAKQKEYMAELARDAEKRRREEEERIERETRERIAKKLQELEERAKKREEEDKQKKAEEKATRDAARRDVDSRSGRRASADRRSADRERPQERPAYMDRRDHAPAVSVIEDDGREWRRRPREAFQPKKQQFGQHGGVRIQKREQAQEGRSVGEAGERNGEERKAARVVQVQVRKAVKEAAASQEGRAKKKHKSARILSVHVLRVPRGQTRAQAEAFALEGGASRGSTWTAAPPASVPLAEIQQEAQAKQAVFSAIAPAALAQQPEAVPQRFEALRPPMADGQAPQAQAQQPQHIFLPPGQAFVPYPGFAFAPGAQASAGAGPVLWDAQRPAQPQSGTPAEEDEAAIQPQWALPVRFAVEEKDAASQEGAKKKRKRRRRKGAGGAGTPEERDSADVEPRETAAGQDAATEDAAAPKKKSRRGKGRRGRKGQAQQEAQPQAQQLQQAAPAPPSAAST